MKKQPKRKARPGVDRYGRAKLRYAALDGDVRRIEELLSEGLIAAAADDDGLAAERQSLARPEPPT